MALTQQKSRNYYQRLTEIARNSLETARRSLVELYQDEGWRLLGYSSFGSYVDGEFPTYSRQYLYRQANAGMLEARLSSIGDSLVGAHPESHLRAIIETTSDPVLQHMAYWDAQERNASTAAEYKRAAMEVVIKAGDNDTLKARLGRGSISVEAAFEILRLVPVDGSRTHAVYSCCNDAELVTMLMAIENSDTWREVIDSLCVPAYDEPIPVASATAANLRAWLDVASAEHRAQWLEDNKTRLEERRERIRTLVELVIGLLPDDYRQRPEVSELITLIGDTK